MVGSGNKNYGYKLPSSFIQTSLTSKGASPELANLHQKRMVWFSEPDKKFKLCTAVMKEITGEGEINARGLYSGNTKTELNNTTDLDTNDIPFLDSIDGGVGRRVIGIPFETTAYDKSVYDTLEDKSLATIKNVEYSTGIWRRKYRQAYFMLLLPYFKKYMKGYSFDFDNLPEKCKKLTEKHMSASDDILSFIHNFYERDCDATEPIKLKDIYKKFKFSELFANLNKKEQRTNTQDYFIDKIQSNFTLKKYVKKRDERYNGIPLKSPCLIGYKLRVEDEDNEEL
jgi:phage/plasmid-associated DNA primase